MGRQVGGWVKNCSKIKHKIMDAPMVEHFVEQGHSEFDFKFCVISKFIKPMYHQVDVIKSLLRYWIAKLNTVMPVGLNQSLELMAFL